MQNFLVKTVNKNPINIQHSSIESDKNKPNNLNPVITK